MNTLFEVVISFGKIGIVALGGGHSMIKLLEYESVVNRHWILKEEFTTMVGSSFLFPGLTAVKLSALIGYKAAGLMGLICAVLALNLPGIILVMFGYQLLAQSSSIIARKCVVAVQYGALALLAAAAYSIAKGVLSAHLSVPLVILSGLFFISLAVFNLSPFWGLLAFIGIAYFVIV